VIILNGRYPQVTLVDGSLASGSSSHTTVAVADCIDQSPTTSVVHQSSQLMMSLLHSLSQLLYMKLLKKQK